MLIFTMAIALSEQKLAGLCIPSLSLDSLQLDLISERLKWMNQNQQQIAKARGSYVLGKLQAPMVDDPHTG